MQKRAIERGLSDVVSFIGHRTDYIDFLAAADLLLLTSREEPFGRVILEAGLFATPTVCFAGSGGAPEFIRDDAGRVVARENVDAMAIAAIELLDSAAITASLGARARERVVHEHSIEVGAPRIWNIVERAIAEHALG
jgi:glycosyltransferase involved in cell wall biosynthesis